MVARRIGAFRWQQQQQQQQQRATVLQKLFLGIKITTQSNYVTLIIICHEHQNKLKCIL